MEKNNIAIIIKRFLSGRFPEKTEERVQRWIIADENTKEKEAASLEYWNELNTEINSDTYSALKRVNQRIGYTKSQTAYIPYHQKLTDRSRTYPLVHNGRWISILYPG